MCSPPCHSTLPQCPAASPWLCWPSTALHRARQAGGVDRATRCVRVLQPSAPAPAVLSLAGRLTRLEEDTRVLHYGARRQLAVVHNLRAEVAGGRRAASGGTSPWSRSAPHGPAPPWHKAHLLAEQLAVQQLLQLLLLLRLQLKRAVKGLDRPDGGGRRQQAAAAAGQRLRVSPAAWRAGDAAAACGGVRAACEGPLAGTRKHQRV